MMMLIQVLLREPRVLVGHQAVLKIQLYLMRMMMMISISSFDTSSSGPENVRSHMTRMMRIVMVMMMVMTLLMIMVMIWPSSENLDLVMQQNDLSSMMLFQA